MPAFSVEPPAEVIERVLTRIKSGSFQVAAWAEEGVPSSLVAKWMAYGEANVKCWTDGVAALEWRGVLYQRTVKATAQLQTPIMHKLAEQARDEGGRTGFDFLDTRFFRNAGYLGSAVGRATGAPTGIGRDIEDQEGQAKDMTSADEAIATINAALENAIAAARVKAAEVV